MTIRICTFDFGATINIGFWETQPRSTSDVVFFELLMAIFNSIEFKSSSILLSTPCFFHTNILMYFTYFLSSF